MILHGDNLGHMANLLAAGRRAHLIYADPPFNTGRTFMLGDEVAYEDRWESAETFLDALKARATLMRALLTEDGSLVLHCDPTMSHYVKVMLDGVFGRHCFANEIIWRYRRWPVRGRHFQWMHDVLLLYRRSPTTEPRWNQLFEPLAKSTVETWGERKQRAELKDGKRVRSTSTAEVSQGAPMSDVWEIGILAPVSRERTGYPTQKPEKLLERVILACSLPGDVVLDPYCGSGTSVAVARRLGREAIGIDASPVAVRVASHRLDGAP